MSQREDSPPAQRPDGVVECRDLAEVSRRVDNAALLGALPDLGVPAETIVADLEAGRGRP